MAIHSIFQSAAVLVAESGLSFLGLGASLESPSWGSLLGSGRAYIFSAPHIIFFPWSCIVSFFIELKLPGRIFEGAF